GPGPQSRALTSIPESSANESSPEDPAKATALSRAFSAYARWGSGTMSSSPISPERRHEREAQTTGAETPRACRRCSSRPGGPSLPGRSLDRALLEVEELVDAGRC